MIKTADPARNIAPADGSSRRTEEIYHEHLDSVRRRTDRLFAGLLFFEWLAGILASLIISPLTWTGPESQTHWHVTVAVALGGLIVSLPIALALLRPGDTLTRHTTAAGQMLMSALLIHLSGGRIETHFHVFGSLAFLAFYRDWPVLLTATVVVAADHFLRGIFWPQSVFGVVAASPWRWVEHAAWVLFEDVFLIASCLRGCQEVREIASKRAALEETNRTLHHKAEQLALSSKYKSEFLANMSHELRTPLNSMLMLSNLLASNREKHLSDREVQCARTINSSGKDLLLLINDILDLSKIEAGQMVLSEEPISFRALADKIRQDFSPIASDKKLTFEVHLHPALPLAMVTDERRLHQVLRNLLGNSFKFTEKGGIVVSIRPVIPAPGTPAAPYPSYSFTVEDTGIGIPADKQASIFEAFQQGDGSISRKYGGTGLGLSITREIMQLLGGEITMVSQVGRGTTMTVVLPSREDRVPLETSSVLPPPRSVSEAPSPSALPLPAKVTPVTAGSVLVDDRATVRPGDPTILIVEDDRTFAGILLQQVRERGFKGIVCHRGDRALTEARMIVPSAILLDVYLPIFDGWEILRRLKDHPRTQHIPVHLLSVDENRQRGLTLGALEHLTKPFSQEELAQAIDRITSYIDRRPRQVLVVEDDPVQQEALAEVLASDPIQIFQAATVEQAQEVLRTQTIDLIILDLVLPGASGESLIDLVNHSPSAKRIPILIHSARDLAEAERQTLLKKTRGILSKEPGSEKGVLDHVVRFLHRIESCLQETQRKVIQELHAQRVPLNGRRILLVDDDDRNIFAMSQTLEGLGMTVIPAGNGRIALETLDRTPDIDLVLMDVMMPEMDGLQATRHIREQDRFRRLPVLSLTAKAMVGDRDACLDAGASDYLSKPIDTDELLSMIRFWLGGSSLIDRNMSGGLN